LSTSSIAKLLHGIFAGQPPSSLHLHLLQVVHPMMEYSVAKMLYGMLVCGQHAPLNTYSTWKDCLQINEVVSWVKTKFNHPTQFFWFPCILYTINNYSCRYNIYCVPSTKRSEGILENVYGHISWVIAIIKIVTHVNVWYNVLTRSQRQSCKNKLLWRWVVTD